ncbi:MAG: hypothetical protein L0H55_01620 [Candidatus Nitrosocosmicus sp.]|nr:hypothetical protein [Candidatus Nitrosocosmicus sp.]
MLKESFVKKRLESMNERVDPIKKQDTLNRSIPDELYSQYEVDEKTYKDLEEAYKKYGRLLISALNIQ